MNATNHTTWRLVRGRRLLVLLVSCVGHHALAVPPAAPSPAPLPAPLFSPLLSPLASPRPSPTGALPVATDSEPPVTSTWRPRTEDHRAWRVTSFLDDAALRGRFILEITFDDRGMAWLATTDGLHAFDGYTWRRYSTAHGLPSDFVRCVRSARDGTLWVGTDRGVATRVGDRFRPLPRDGRLAGPNVRRIVEDPDGALWFCSDGWLNPDVPAGLARRRDGVWTTFREADGLPGDYVSDFFCDTSGRRFVLTRNGLAQRTRDGWIRPLEQLGLTDAGAYMWSIAETPTTGVMVATRSAFFLLRNGTWSRRTNDDRTLGKPHLTATRDGEIITVSNADEKAFLRWNGEAFEPVTETIHAPGLVEMVREAPDGSIWCVGLDTLLRWRRRDIEWTEHADLPPPRLVDDDGDVWFAGPQGVVCRSREGWTRRDDASAILVSAPDGAVWGVRGDRVVRFDDGETHVFSPARTGLTTPRQAIVDRRGRVWYLGLAGDGRQSVSIWDGAAWTLRSPDALQTSGMRLAAADGDDGVWLQASGVAPAPARLVHLRGDRVTVLDAPDVTILQDTRLHVDRAGTVRVFGAFGLLEWGGAEWTPVHDLPGRHVAGIVEIDDTLWFGCSGLTGGRSALSRLHDGQWTHFDVEVRRLVGRGDGVAAFAGFRTVYVVESAHGPPRRIPVPVAGVVREVVAGRDGDLWMRVGSAVVRYHPDGVPPETTIVGAARDVMADEPLVARFAGRERFESGPGRSCTFSWRIDGGPWSRFGPSPADGLPLPAGEGSHLLEVRARDGGLDVDPVPARHAFVVHPVPLQERVWFRPAVVATGAMFLVLSAISLALLVRARSAAQQLEEKVESRTADLRESEERFRRLVEHATDTILLHDLDGRMVDVNEHACTSLGYDRDTLLAMTMREIQPGWTPLTLDSWTATTIDGVHRRRDGSTFPVQSRLRPLAAGGRRLVLAMARDVTEWKREEARQKFMLAELDHRVRNNLATVQAIADQTVQRAGSLDEFRSSFTGRIQALAQTHTMLAGRHAAGVELADLVRLMLAPYGRPERTRFRLHGPVITLPASLATKLGLAIHELTTNAAKHGSLSVPDGGVDVSWTAVDDLVELTWVEHGGPPVAAPTEHGFGLGFVESTLRYDFGAEAVPVFRPQGVTWTIRIPLADRTTAGIGPPPPVRPDAPIVEVATGGQPGSRVEERGGVP